MNINAKTILVVDDEPSILLCIESMFVLYGCRVLLASTGEEALEMAADLDETVDLLVTDVVLPKMNGADLARHFGKKYPATKILFMSGYLSPSISTDEYEMRQRAFIQKPFLIKDLLKMSARLLEA